MTVLTAGMPEVHPLVATKALLVQRAEQPRTAILVVLTVAGRAASIVQGLAGLLVVVTTAAQGGQLGVEVLGQTAGLELLEKGLDDLAVREDRWLVLGSEQVEPERFGQGVGREVLERREQGPGPGRGGGRSRLI